MKDYTPMGMIPFDRLEALIRAYEKAREKNDNQLVKDTMEALLELWAIRKNRMSRRGRLIVRNDVVVEN